MRQRWLIATLLSFAATANAEVRVTGEGCLDAAAVQGVLETVVSDAAGDRRADLDVAAESSAFGDATTVSLRAGRPHGGALLVRSYELRPADCTEGPALLALVLRRFLEGLPVEEWTHPPPAPAPPSRDPLGARVSVFSGVHGTANPAGGEAGIGLRAALGRGGANALALSVIGRSGPSRPLGDGRYQPASLLGGAGWRHDFRRTTADLELRGGAVRLAGVGFDDNETDWMPWIEASASASWHARGFRFGPSVSVSPLQSRVRTRDGASETLPGIRAGFFFEAEFLSPKKH